MNKIEFLEGLKAYLEPEVDASVVRENLDYYSRYISDEVQRGRSEAEVIEELGDPWVIAKTISDMQDEDAVREEVYEAGGDTGSSYGSYGSYGNVKTFQFDTWWKKLLLAIGFVAVLVVVISIVTGIIGFLIPILVPVLVIMLVFRIINNRR